MDPDDLATDTEKMFRIHVLDMGAKKYGDCIVCQVSNTES